MQRGKEVQEQINILGDDGVPLEYHITFWKSEVLDFVLLQQDAFDKVDSVTPLDRQKFMLDLVTSIVDTEFEFDGFAEVMDYFKRIINACKQMNYSPYESEDFNKHQAHLNEIIQERAVKN